MINNTEAVSRIVEKDLAWLSEESNEEFTDIKHDHYYRVKTRFEKEVDFKQIEDGLDTLEAKTLKELVPELKMVRDRFLKFVETKFDHDAGFVRDLKELRGLTTVSDKVYAFLLDAYDLGSRIMAREIGVSRQGQIKAAGYAFDPDQPRDEGGQWTDTGGGDVSLTPGSIPNHDTWKDLPADPEFVYHATNLDNSLDIKGSGLMPHSPSFGSDQNAWPDGSRSKRSYFSPKPEFAWKFAPAEGKPILLRMKRSVTKIEDEGTGDLFVRDRAPASSLEVLTNDGWKPLANSVKIHAEAPNFRPRDAQRYLKAKAFWITGLIDTKIREKARRILLNAIGTGEALPKTIQKLSDTFEPYVGDENVLRDDEVISPSRLETIVRTNATDAFNQGRVVEARKAGEFLVGFQWSSVLDKTTTEVCQYLDGKAFRPDDPALDVLKPSRHFSCRSVLVPISIDEQVDEDDFITPAEVEVALSLSGEDFGGPARSTGMRKAKFSEQAEIGGSRSYKLQKRGNEWCAVSEDGTKTFGCYPTEAQARERLRQIEAIKAAKK